MRLGAAEHGTGIFKSPKIVFALPTLDVLALEFYNIIKLNKDIQRQVSVLYETLLRFRRYITMQF